ncbi:hypothetical protein BDV39DRAFT_173264 [Aspergillus sergii]|uniref:Uncharacterized protein n=1 Tax=Aspergillus sergii TaxID=1034303 RepID=A0A5N6X6F5_9EURO|nr:hypothetical protein BDV39DRAFT_173264 [Aspergillus sergii]
MPNDQYCTVLYPNWDIADRRFWSAWHRDCGNGRTGGLNLNQRCHRQMGFIMTLRQPFAWLGKKCDGRADGTQ